MSAQRGSSAPTSPAPAGGVITRQGLKDGSLLAHWRATALPGSPVRTDEEIEASLAQAMMARPNDGDIWIFAFGSLLWNTTFEFVEERVAIAHGWHRRFCVWIRTGRGSPDSPGLTLALDSGGSCAGVAFRIARQSAPEELLLLWRREMASGVYQARWIDVELAGGDDGSEREVKAIAFVANREHSRFAGALSDAEVAERISEARGSFGTSLEYFTNTVARLETMGLVDEGLDRIRRLVVEGRKPPDFGQSEPLSQVTRRA